MTLICKFGKILLKLFNTIVLLAVCIYCGCILTFGQIDFSLIILHADLVFSYPLFPFWKEFILGLLLFSCLLYISWRYWKVSTIICCIIVFSLLAKDKELFLFKDTNTSFFKREYIILPPKLAHGQKAKNIIVISLESIEDIFTFDDVTGAGSLIPRLESLKKEGLSFDGYYGMKMLEPTIPSFYAKNCSIPSYLGVWSTFKNLWLNHKYGSFPNAKCVSDVLKENGYKVFYVMGGQFTDEGAKNFFDAHPIDSAVGKEELKKMGYQVGNGTWFIPDSEIFKYSKKILSEPKREPFALYIVTANTHHRPDGNYFVEQNCTRKFGDGRDSILCFDETVYNFVRWIQEQPWYKDTVVYLIGDHHALGYITMIKDMHLILDNAKNHPKRQVYTLMLDGIHKNQIIKKEYTHLDFAPTFLESIGFIAPKFGLGYSLFRDNPTLVEKFGIDNLTEELKKSSDDFYKIVGGSKWK